PISVPSCGGAAIFSFFYYSLIRRLRQPILQTFHRVSDKFVICRSGLVPTHPSAAAYTAKGD
ncbi:hypothetical protein, partial [Ruminococcus champanellensis]|uniref:hypothetical protein n=1 Tax=Ruminococcus champanellensis TaxID=1161942 RepID=UPI0023F067B8